MLVALLLELDFGEFLVRLGLGSRLFFWPLCVGLLLSGCESLPDSFDLDDDVVGDTGGEILPGDNSVGNHPNLDASQILIVELVGPQGVAADELVSVQAQVPNAEDGELFYLWEYALLDGAGAAEEPLAQASQAADFIKDWHTMTFYPADLFPHMELSGKVLRVRANVIENSEERREGFGDRILTIGAGNKDVVFPDDDMDDLGMEEPDEEELEEEEEEEENSNDNEDDDPVILGGGGGSNQGGNGNSNQNGNPDPCDGITDLTVTLPASLSMSLFEGYINLSPTVCSGTAPFVYDWTPTTYLEEGSSGLGGGPSGSVESPDADFRPDSTGTYNVTVQVTDDDLTTESATVTITVNAYNPLIVNAGGDVAVTQGDALNLTGTVLGGSGNYSYSWSPTGPTAATYNNVPTGSVGDTTYTFTVTDTDTSTNASGTVKVVVLAAGGSCTNDYAMGVSSGDFVAFDSGYGAAGQAVIVSGAAVVLYDMNTATVRATLALPSSGQGLAVDSARGRAYVSTRLSGQFTRSVQVIDLDNAVLGSNIGLTANVASANGMAVVPSTGDVLVAVTGGSGTDGLMVLSAGASLGNALQNIHHTSSFAQPVDVAVVEQGALSVAVVANMTNSAVTLVPLASITFTPDDGTGGGLSALPQIAANGAVRAVVAQPTSSRVIVGWNDGDQGRVQIITLTDNQSGSAGSDILISGAVLTQGLAIHSGMNLVFAATGSDDVSTIDLTYELESAILQGAASSAQSVASQEGIDNRILIVGNGSNLSERCP